MASESTAELKTTALTELHLELGAKMVAFAGYSMPVQFPLGVLQEHLHTREAAGLFDVSHMGQIRLYPNSGSVDDVARDLERLVPVDILGLGVGRQRYAFLTTPEGTLIDDLMIARFSDHLQLVVNAARKSIDIAHLRNFLGAGCEIRELSDRSLLALQGPCAERVLDALAPGAREMRFMDAKVLQSNFGDLTVTRSGYTGEDGFEVSVSNQQVLSLARAILEYEDVEPIGLGARDSLRLEAGLCLYGNDIDESTSPIEAGLKWAIQKARRSGGERAGGFPGDGRILKEIDEGPARLRIGLQPQGRAPMRAGTELFQTEDATKPIGTVTSGAYGPSVEAPISMGYVPLDLAEIGTKLFGEVRGRRMPLTVCTLPFQQNTYKRP